MGVGIARSQSFPRPMSINGLRIPLWESGYLISWVSGSQAERLVTDYFQIIPRYICEMHALNAGDMDCGMEKRAAIQLCQAGQPFAPVDTGQPTPPCCGACAATGTTSGRNAQGQEDPVQVNRNRARRAGAQYHRVPSGQGEPGAAPGNRAAQGTFRLIPLQSPPGTMNGHACAFPSPAA